MTTAQPGRAYLDHAATTPLLPEALAAMLPYLGDRFGNPSGMHARGRTARRALDDARERLAEAVGAEPGEIVFTSGGTEADNLAVTGAWARSGQPAPGEILCSAVEHPAVLRPVSAAGGRKIATDARGVVDLDALADLLSPTTRLVSVMLVNNETGVVQPLREVVRLVRELAPGALVHTDAVQAISWLDLAGEVRDADLVTVSAHKFGGPPGIGALVVRGEQASRLRPGLLGGPQERERRAGTPNLPGAVAMSVAAEATVARRGDAARIAALADKMVDGLVARVPGVLEAVPRTSRVPAICNLEVEAVEAEELLILLDELGVEASAGSSCASGALEPSHVLLAMGVEPGRARTHVRLSLGHSSTAADVELVLSVFPKAVEQLRE